jgi:Na+/melibiose symporter-like transporter
MIQAIAVPIVLAILEMRFTPKKERLTSLFYPYALIIVFIFIANYDLIVAGINSGLGEMFNQIGDNATIRSLMFISLLLPIVLLVFTITIRVLTLKRDSSTHNLIEVAKMVSTVLFVIFMFLYYRETI